MIDLMQGDCVDVMALTMEDNSVDAIVTDPPYELGFMGKTWDATGIAYSPAMWSECLRVLKPGGHLLAFSSSRTYHRMVCAIEDAGFEIRDQIMYVYGSGFPKSLDVSKAIDKAGGNPHLSVEIGKAIKAAREQRGLSIVECDKIFCGGSTNWYFFEGRAAGQRAPSTTTFTEIVKAWPELSHLQDQVAEVERAVIGKNPNVARAARIVSASGGGGIGFGAGSLNDDITAPATDAAKRWEGWGTALKPAHEPIAVARKPLVGTVAANVLQWGTGGLNIDGCRVEGEPVARINHVKNGVEGYGSSGLSGGTHAGFHSEGRWPANVIHDGSDEVLAAFPSGEHRFFYCAKASKKDRNEGCDALPKGKPGMNSNTSGQHITRRDEGYAPEPVANNHPTVKPTDLMAYLCRLVTPPGGVILDPFLGSGSTGKAAVREGFSFIGIEKEAPYMAIARARIEHEMSK